MREWLTVVLGALLSAALVYGLLFPKPRTDLIETRPTSDDPGPSGQLAARRWLEREGITTFSLRERFTVLNDEDHVTYGPGNLLIVVMPQLHRARREEISELRQWIAAGNTLVLLAALNDTPAWSYAGDFNFMHADLKAITGTSFVMKPARTAGHGRERAFIVRDSRLDEPAWHEIRLDDRHWLTADVGLLHGRSDLPTASWQLKDSDEAGLFEIGGAAEDGRGVLWLLAHGDGQILLSSYGSLFENDVIGHIDNRKLLANLASFHVERGGVIIFDDMHQGLSTLYDPEAFFSDPRLHHSLLFIIALWIVYAVFAGNRLGGVTPAEVPRRQADFVRSAGYFLARKVAPSEAAQRLFANLFADARMRSGPDSPPRWQVLASNPLLDERVIARLRSRFEALQAGGRVNLETLQDDIAELRRALH